MIVRLQSLSIIGLIDPRHVYADISLLFQALCRGATVRFLEVKTFQHRFHSGSGEFRHRAWHPLSSTSTRSRRPRHRVDHGFFSRRRLMRFCESQPGQSRPGLREVYCRVRNGQGRRAPACEPNWDGRLYD